MLAAEEAARRRRILTVEGRGPVIIRPGGRIIHVPPVLRVGVAIADIEIDIAVLGEQPALETLRQAERGAVAFIARPVGNLQLVVAAGAEAGGGDVPRIGEA